MRDPTILSSQMLGAHVLRRRLGRAFPILGGIIALVFLIAYRYSSAVPNRTPQRVRGSPVYSSDARRTPSQRQKDGDLRMSSGHNTHNYRDDGLLHVNPNADKHPILKLIHDSRKKWEIKIAAQSRTLSSAVQEYERRYRRSPPLGFDTWWKFVIDHSVQLPDEYNQIWHDIEPFWGMSPTDLQWLQTRAANGMGTFTINVQNHISSVLKVSMPPNDVDWATRRATERLELIQDIEKYLPDINITYTAHDPPHQFVSHKLKARALEAAKKGTYIDIDYPVDREHLSWGAACPPTSPLYFEKRFPNHRDFQPIPSEVRKSFIYDHLRSMDPCLHPAHARSIGILLAQVPDPREYMPPTFGMSTSLLHTDILTPTLEHFRLHQDSIDHIEWADKPDERLLWRGLSTGLEAKASDPEIDDGSGRRAPLWRRGQRQRLVDLLQTGNFAKTNERIVQILDPAIGASSPIRNVPGPGSGNNRNNDNNVGGKKSEGVLRITAGELNEDLMDVAFGDDPVQCAPSICKEMLNTFKFTERQSHTEGYNYRYVIDVDGNGWSARFKRLMLSNSVVFKSTIHPEWFSDRIQPWVHFVPVKVDFSDIYDIMTFFRGIKMHDSGSLPDNVDSPRRGGHPALAEEIAKAGPVWSQQYWRREDMDAYTLRVMLEYARVMSDDRDAMSFKYDEKIHGNPSRA